MDVWVIPLIFVTLIICLISFLGIRKSSKEKMMVEGRTEINQPVENHPLTLNPIIWIMLVATSFIGLVIVYYAASF